MMASTSSSRISKILASFWIPALAKRMSGVPNSATARSTEASTADRILTSVSKKRTDPENASASPASPLTSRTATSNPSDANFRTEAAPIPVAPPVMITLAMPLPGR